MNISTISMIRICETYIECSYCSYIYTKNIGISKHEKHLRILSSGTKRFYYLWVKRFFDIRREIYILSILAFSSRVAPATRPRELAKVNRLLLRQDSIQLTDFFKITQILRVRASGAWSHSHPLVNLSIGFLFWHLWTIRPPCTRVNTCTQVCTQLTHVLSRKFLSLTKPKGIKRNSSAIILHICWSMYRVWN